MRLTSWTIHQVYFFVAIFVVSFLANDLAGQVIWDRAQIDRTRNGEYDKDSQVALAVNRLKKAADSALKNELYSVTHKEGVPPSGDIHDYLSYSRYWWPDPKKPDGLPFIRKDGVSNDEQIAKGDRDRLGKFQNDVQTLGLAGYVLKEPRYTRHAVKLVRAWFIDEATYMNPNLNYAQGVPGREDGRSFGIIDVRGFMLVLDTVELFDETNWTAEDQAALRSWFDEFQQWLGENPLGQKEASATNNHGTWFAAQRARYALFVGREDIAREIVQGARQRLATQFDAEGNQAAELKRTRALFYSVFNITAMSRVARVGEHIDENLWEFIPQHGCGMQKAFEGLLPYITGESKWPHAQMKEFYLTNDSRMTFGLFSKHFEDDKYNKAAEKVRETEGATRDFTAIVMGEPQSGKSK